MLIRNTDTRFGIVAILLHWLMAFLVIGLLAGGLYMTSLPLGVQKLRLYGLHKEFGFLLLILVCLRLVWRVTNINPRLDIPRWERFAALATHWALYGFMFAMPITGWLVTSAAGFPVSFFGLFTIPTLIAPDEQLLKTFASLHESIAYALLLTIIVHTLAAFKHHFIDKDDILRRMIR